MPRPALIAVHDEPDSLASLERELRKRYGADYEVSCFDDPASGPSAVGEGATAIQLIHSYLAETG